MTEGLTSAKHVALRHVELNDAEFIVSLRKDPKKNKHLSSFSGGVEDQKEWISKYKEREKTKKEKYFVIVSQDEDGAELKYGVVRIYDYRDDSFCWGSWILKDNVPSYTAIESALLVYIKGFYELGFSKSHFDVRKENDKVNTFHLKMGASFVSEDELNNYYTFTKEAFSLVQSRYKKFLK